jgi:methionyl-tRNA formyltransferase
MDEGLDTGPVLRQQAVPILPDTTAGALAETLAELGARLMLQALDGVAAGKLSPQPQPSEGITYAPKLRREETRLDWRQPADALERQVRAFAPAPCAWFSGGGERIRVLGAEAEPQAANVPPGTVLDDRLGIACGAGVFRPLILQRPGRGALNAAAFLRGFPIPAGTQLPCPATS